MSSLMLILFVNIILIKQLDAVVIGYNQMNFTEEFQDFEAEFGTEVGKDGLMGFLVPAKPFDACTAIENRPEFPPQLSDNITYNAFVLIKRGGCDFAQKVLNAQKANFNAAIVANKGSEELLHMGTYFPELQAQINIPSVFVGETAGYMLNVSYVYNLETQPYVKITRGEAPFPFKWILLLFGVVMGTSVFVLVTSLVVRVCKEQRRRRRSRLSRRRLKELPTKQWLKSDKVEYDTCAICIEDFEEGDLLRILPCNHAYHCKCVDPWLTTGKRVCPLCKRRVLSDDEVSDDEDYFDEDSDTNEEAPLLGSNRDRLSSNNNNTSNHYGSALNNSSRSFLPTASNPAETLYHIEENYFADDELPKVHMVQPNNPSTSTFQNTLISRSAPSDLKYALNPAYTSDFNNGNQNEIYSSTNSPPNLSSSESSIDCPFTNTEKNISISNSNTFNSKYDTSDTSSNDSLITVTSTDVIKNDSNSEHPIKSNEPEACVNEVDIATQRRTSSDFSNQTFWSCVSEVDEINTTANDRTNLQNSP